MKNSNNDTHDNGNIFNEIFYGFFYTHLFLQKRLFLRYFFER